MTKEEAIQRFQRMKKILAIPNSDAERTAEAIDMAIEALQTDLVRCKDCKWHKLIGCEIKIVDDSDRPKDNDYCIFGERREP